MVLVSGWLVTMANTGDSNAIIDDGVVVAEITRSHRIQVCGGCVVSGERGREWKGGVAAAAGHVECACNAWPLSMPRTARTVASPTHPVKHSHPPGQTPAGQHGGAGAAAQRGRAAGAAGMSPSGAGQAAGDGGGAAAAVARWVCGGGAEVCKGGRGSVCGSWRQQNRGWASARSK
jgi:hypothetical protein